MLDLPSLAPGHPVEVVFRHADGEEHRIRCRHTMSEDQIDWFWAGAALNSLKADLG